MCDTMSLVFNVMKLQMENISSSVSSLKLVILLL